MLTKRVQLSNHVIDQMVERNFAGQKDRKKIRVMVLTDLKPLNIRKIEKQPTKTKYGETQYRVWTKGGRQYRLAEEATCMKVITGIQHNRASNKHAVIK